MICAPKQRVTDHDNKWKQYDNKHKICSLNFEISGSITDCFCIANITGSEWQRKPHTSKLQMAAPALTLKIRWIQKYLFSVIDQSESSCEILPIVLAITCYHTKLMYA